MWILLDVEQHSCLEFNSLCLKLKLCEQAQRGTENYVNKYKQCEKKINEGLFINTQFITDPIYGGSRKKNNVLVQKIRKYQPHFKNYKWSKCLNYILDTNETCIFHINRTR